MSMFISISISSRLTQFSVIAIGCSAIIAAVQLPVFAAQPAVSEDALGNGKLGLYAARDFRLTDGACKDCAAPPQALWYFRDELIAVPQGAAADFTPTLAPQNDVRNWLASHPNGGDRKRPPLIWLGSPELVSGARLVENGTAITVADGGRMPFAITPKIATNLSYYNESSTQFFAQRSLRMRGKTVDGRFVARTIWPEDYALDFATLPYAPLASGESLQSLVRQVQAPANTGIHARVLWQRHPEAPRAWGNQPVVAFVLNGAQGDDDEAHGGHFAVATGAFGEHGQWGDWLVNNFYNLDSVSEKGIIAATLPMDAYMADLNSGQSWYRPSYMLVAVLKQPRAANLYQEAISRVYAHFYRHDFHYRHATANCAGISIDTLRSLGWAIPFQGPTSRLKATIGLPYMALKDMSLDSGRKAYDYMIAERTDLYPFVAFEEAGQDLLQRLLPSAPSSTTAGSKNETRHISPTGLEAMLADDVEALIYVRIPQLPSSRAFGQAPVASIDEYMKRVPEDKSQWKIVPVAARPFPDEFKDPHAPTEPIMPSTIALIGYGIFFAICLLFLTLRIMRKRRERSNRLQK